jgi:VanZ family protein
VTSVLLPLRHARIWASLGGFLLVIILILALVPEPGQLPISYNDKFAHGLAFMALMLWFSGVVEVRRLPMLAICLAAYGVLIELLQSLTATRQPEFLDLGADLAGILLGWLLSMAGLRRWCFWLESGLDSWRASEKR